MTIEEAEKNVGKIVVFDRRDYNFGGRAYTLHSAWREINGNGCRDYGIELAVCGENSLLEAQASYVELVPYDGYLPFRYVAAAGIAPKEALSLLGQEVNCGGERVLLRRLYKVASGQHIRYEVEIQRLCKPYNRQRRDIGEIKKIKN